MSDFYTNMKILFCLLLFITQCEQPKTSESHINFDVSGNYHWKSDKRSNYDRDNYMILTKKGDKIKGYYYGNSDEFSLSPHGLWPGYFVLEMQDLTFHEDSIKFKLKPRSDDFFNEPVKFSFFTSEDALKDGNTKWNFIENFQFNPVKEYIGFSPTPQQYGSIKTHFIPKRIDNLTNKPSCKASEIWLTKNISVLKFKQN